MTQKKWNAIRELILRLLSEDHGSDVLAEVLDGEDDTVIWPELEKRLRLAFGRRSGR